MIDESWLLYKASVPASRPDRALPQGAVCEMWRPGVFSVKPQGMPVFPFGVWWLFHILHVFSNRDYGLFVIRRGSKIVHRSVITPGYLRFPFMTRDDIQVGDTWTDPEVRGTGLATIALENILTAARDGNRTCWYVVEADNAASIRVVEKAGFTLAGHGIRTRRLGLRVLGQFRLEECITVQQGAVEE
jgi:RimJ/RimL family protein N-acetyltransferase